MKKINKKSKKTEKNQIQKYYIIFLLTIISLILIIPLCRRGYYIIGHDSLFHLANITSIKLNFMSGNWLFAKIYPFISRGFGYGAGIFYGPMVHYITSYLNYIFDFFSLITIMKIMHLVTILLSMVSMYFLCLKITKRKFASILGAVLYVTFPYFMSDIYVRDAYAESLTFIFLPMIFNGLYELLYLNNSKKFFKLFIPSVSLLVITHNITTLYAAIFVVLFLILNAKKAFLKNKVKALVTSIVFITSITSFYLVPLALQRVYSDINIFSKGAVSSPDTVASYALSLKKFIPVASNQSIDGIQFFILIPMVILCIISMIIYRKININNKKLFLDFLVLGVLAFLMTTNIFPWKFMPSLFAFIQFPWRLLIFADLFLSVFSLLCIINTDKEVLLTLFTIPLIILNEMLILNTNRVVDYSNIHLDLSTDGIGAVNDYLPKKTVESFDYYMNRNSDVKVIHGDGSVEILRFQAPYIKISVKTDDILEFELPLLYYYGYTVTSSLETEEKILLSESDNGFIKMAVSQSGIYIINFTGSSLMKISYYYSIFSIIVYIIFINKFKEDKMYEKK